MNDNESWPCNTHTHTHTHTTACHGGTHHHHRETWATSVFCAILKQLGCNNKKRQNPEAEIKSRDTWILLPPPAGERQHTWRAVERREYGGWRIITFKLGDSQCVYMQSNYWLSRTEIELSVSCQHLCRTMCGPTSVRLTPLDSSVRSSW